MNPGRTILYIISAILFGLFWVSGGDELMDYLPYYSQRFVGRTVTVQVQEKVIYAEVARSDRAKARGLGKRQNLPTQKGMLFPFVEPGLYEFWMKDMRISIDIVWIHSGKIVDISHGVPPPAVGQDPARIRPPVPVDTVLEVAGGMATQWKPGDAVTIKADKPFFLP